MAVQLTIFQDSRRPGTCRSCGAAIEWAELTTGARMPFNRIQPLHSQASLFFGARILESIDTLTSPTHFETCPDAKGWRKP